MKKIFLGAPGSGKGSYASRIAPKRNIPHISTGDLFRKNIDEETKIGMKAKEFMNKGDLVPDEIVIEMLKNRIENEDCDKGFILDGFPRTIHQAEKLAEITDIDLAVNMSVPDDIIIKRISSRVTCKDCGEIFNIITHKPKEDGICDKCQGEVITRSDQKPEIIQNRLNVYQEQTAPLINFYKDKGILQHVSCDDFYQSVDEMAQKVLESITSFSENITNPTREVTSEILEQ
jgi:adenylate kinase